MTPVLLALHLEKKDVVLVLIENGADVNSPSADVRYCDPICTKINIVCGCNREILLC